ncbi:hypothetical protein N0V82_002314 [Gnomoniopsis sp. IMI 355080]|nr:hypothetical protein N0V82_002314 [Gnomoniopsis sp. IMI 355080]
MEHIKESPNVSPVEDINQRLDEDTSRRGRTTRKRETSLPNNNLSIHPAPYNPFMTLQSPVFSSHALAAPPNNERSYLLEDRQRQQERGKRLADALHIIEVQITSSQSKGDTRKLRKEASLLKKKITESLRQEELILLRLKDFDNEEYRQNPYWQAQSAGSMPYATHWSPYSPMAPWTPMTLPMMSPIHGPVSPLTPLPPGLYHPSPIIPSPLTSPYWLGVQYQNSYQTMGPYVQTDPAYYTGVGFQQSYMPDFIAVSPSRRHSLAATNAKLGEFTNKTSKSVDFELPQEGAYRGRRWSLADTFSPKPKDKRMSTLGLQTIWKENEEKDEQMSGKGSLLIGKAIE